MDTVVYPDAAVIAAASKFVCIRVKFDDNPELLKKFAVKPLPDIRFLNSDGVEMAKSVGFLSVNKFLEITDKIFGKSSGEVIPKKNLVRKEVTVTKEAIDAAVQNGSKFIKQSYRSGLKVDGLNEMALFAMASCGVDSSDEDFAHLLKSIIDLPPTMVYQAAFRALALSKINPKSYQAQLGECRDYLIRSQLQSGGWTYAKVNSGANATADMSNTTYAVLGLACCRKFMISVPDEVFERGRAFIFAVQNSDGGWGYRTDHERESYESMTENAIGSLYAMGDVAGIMRTKANDFTHALKWLNDNFTVEENKFSSYQEGRLYYHLFALERVGTLSAAEKIKDRNWFEDGAKFILETQNDDGSWDDGADTPVQNTCFALLFLKRASSNLRK